MSSSTRASHRLCLALLGSLAAALACAAGACDSGHVVGTEHRGSGGASGIGGAQGGAGGTGTGGGVGGRTTGTGGGLLVGTGGTAQVVFDPPTCGAALPAFTGSLCGPATAPCKMLIDESVDANAVFRNRQPAVATDPQGRPQLIFATADGSYSARWGARTAAGAWQTELMPMPVATASLVVAGDGTPAALVNNGAIPGTSLWRRDASGWTRLDGAGIGGYEAYDAGSLIATQDGCFHAALLAYDTASAVAVYPGYGLWNGRWNLVSLGYSYTGGIAPGVALAPDGTVNLAVWKYDTQPTGRVSWARRGTVPVPIDGPNGPTDEPLRALITMVTPTGAAQPAPHLLYRALPNGGVTASASTLIEAWPLGDGTFSHQTIASSSGTTLQACPTPTQGSSNCMLDFTEVAPVAILGSNGGGTRTLFTSTHQKVTLMSVCMGGLDGAPVSCIYQRMAATSDAQLTMAWRNDDGSIGRAMVTASTVPGEGALSASAVVDATGHIHIAIYDGVNSSTVRYLMLGS